jgi:hypothetical protein
MRRTIRLLTAALFLSGLAVYGQTPSSPEQTPQRPNQPIQGPTTKDPKGVPVNQPPSAGADVGHGAGDIGKGAGGAAGNTAKGAGNLVTLHPVGAGRDLGKGGKDLGVGAAKGTGKIAKGTGRGIGHLFHHAHKDPSPDTAPPQTP